MSRIGKSPVTIPDGVTINISDDNLVTVKGKMGELSEKIDSDLKLSINDGVLTLERPSEEIRHRAVHGLSRALIANMVEGVSNGFKKELDLVGVGYRAAVQGQQLDMSLGYSHNIVFDLPEEVKATAVMQKGIPPRVTLESIDKQLLGQVAAKIRSMRKPEPYKGKGVRYSDEVVRRKAGKSAG